MKLFSRKEEKLKVGRPKLADMDLKKKSIIMSVVSLLLVIILLGGSLISFNIVPKLRRLKGEANINLCSEIPVRFQPRSESNPDGLHEYGFTDTKFYSAVVSSYNSDASYCSTITEDQLKSITSIDPTTYSNSQSISNISGIQYLTGLINLNITNSVLKNLSELNNPSLTSVYVDSHSLVDVDLSGAPALTRLSLKLDRTPLNNVNLSNNKALTSLEINGSYTSCYIDLSNNTALTNLDLSNNSFTSIDVSKNTALTSLNLSSNNLSSIDLSNNKALTSVNLSSNKFTSYSTIGDSIKLRQGVITAYPDDTTYSIDNPNIATYNNGVINKVSSGITILRATYKISDSYSYTIDYYITFKELKLTSNYYLVDNNTKTIDGKGIFLSDIDVNKINLSLPEYKVAINNNELQIIDVGGSVVDVYKIVNVKIPDENAYLKAGFKDKNLYTCVVKENYRYHDKEGNFLLTDEEMKSISRLYCNNKNISDTTGIEKLTNLSDLDLSYNNIESINLENNTKLRNISLVNNKLTSLDVSKNLLLETLLVANNKIENIRGLNNLESLVGLMVYNNNLSSLNLSKSSNIVGMIIDNNPLSNTLYMLKGSSIDYKDDIKLNSKYKIAYDIANKDVVSYKESILKALKEGITTVKMSNENIQGYKSDFYDKNFVCAYLQDEKACEELDNMSEEEVYLPYFISQEIKVYDILSDAYKVDKDKKTIDALNKDFDASLINITLNGLTGTLENDKFIIKDGETIVDIYKIINMKKVVDKPSNGTANNKTTTTEDLSDIKINGTFVNSLMLQTIKGIDRNIILENEGITFTINGKDIEKVEGNLDLSYELKALKESVIYSKVKDKLLSGIVLSFKGNNNLPGKVLVDVDITDKIKKNIGIKDLYLYNYDRDKMTLIAENINLYNNKLSFYINKLGNYVLTNNEVNKKNIDIDSSMYEENDELSKDISNKKLIIPIIIFIILIILGIIGYLTYRKNKGKNV